jgi:hypothetical protein
MSFISRSLFFSLLLVCNVFSFAQFAGGTGTEEDPWQIKTLTNLENVRNYLGANHTDKFFIQIADIDAADTRNWDSEAGFLPIGSDTAFAGNYDGYGYKIRNLYIDRTNLDRVGLFGRTDGATLKNIHLENHTISGKHRVGGIVGNMENSKISNCSASGSVNGTSGWIGGLVGYGYFATIKDCHSSGSVLGSGNSIGGLIGLYDFYSEMENCYSNCNLNITPSSWGIGGLIGQSNSPISNCYATGDISGGARTGGFIGLHSFASIDNSYSTGNVQGRSFMLGGFIGENRGAINNCYALGNITATRSTTKQVGGFIGKNSGTIQYSFGIGEIIGTNEDIGGFIGENDNGTITNSYWNTETSNMTFSDGGEGRTTSQMTFPYANNTYTEWNFDLIWAEDINSEKNEGYPYFDFTRVILTISTQGQGKAMINNLEYTEPMIFNTGKEVQLEVIPDEGWEFEHWTHNDTILSTDANFVFTMPENNANIIAVFQEMDNSSANAIIEDYLKLFPNPANNHITIQSDFIIERIALFGIDGKVLKEQNLNNNSHIIDVSDLLSGVYFIQIYSNTKTVIKIVKIAR